jgi:RNA polymerase sigma factor (TIGR02999 family)
MSTPPVPPRPPSGRPTPSGSPNEVTRLLRAWSSGDSAALDALFPLVYAELRRQAERAMRREAAGHTLQPTGLVHEAFLRMVGPAPASLESRAQFFGIAGRCMRRVLVDHARARQAAKRGGAAGAITLSDCDALAEEPEPEVLGLHEALEKLETTDPELSRLVELRYFGGLTIDETAAALEISPATVKREWAVARAWLRRELHAGGGEAAQ